MSNQTKNQTSLCDMFFFQYDVKNTLNEWRFQKKEAIVEIKNAIFSNREFKYNAANCTP